jgi:hypothetical protein
MEEETFTEEDVKNFELIFKRKPSYGKKRGDV